MTLRVRVERDALHTGEHRAVRFMRTVRIPHDNRQFPLPPGLGAFPVEENLADLLACKHGGYARLMAQSEWMK